ncbi:uncharacterized protein LAESUDRAFT_241011 [Laetiporus sulphureus 93-53]|uniref:Uncharacterized protein n=1 Tax=Laetiporus sulphureus 93-53 TaxID=1314785 RepID=A0A165DKF7_9APHY|nr:uncharacterized protein LAESUDRAFT_241011 [Laetiporus sulphureus 93-53]KZT05077.1 hypothetical protein LAESUDRAFT_241011 [Laetiporus sulphureus 93-53]
MTFGIFIVCLLVLAVLFSICIILGVTRFSLRFNDMLRVCIVAFHLLCYAPCNPTAFGVATVELLLQAVLFCVCVMLAVMHCTPPFNDILCVILCAFLPGAVTEALVTVSVRSRYTVLPGAVTEALSTGNAWSRYSSTGHSFVGGGTRRSDSVSTSELRAFPVVLGSRSLLALHSSVKYRCQLRRENVTSLWEYGA